MNTLIALQDRLFAPLEKSAPFLMPTLARLIFAGTLLLYYWTSGLTKIGEGALGIVRLDFGAYAQILPRVFENVGYDPGQLGPVARAVALAGTWAEFVLPALIVLGLFTRLAALGMAGFVLAQSWVDIVGHGAGTETVGAWFDRMPDAAILDQRAFWLFLLLVLAVRGGGPLSLDRALSGQRTAA